MINRGFMIAAYSLCILLGLLTVLFPVTSIVNVLTLHFTYFYGLMILVGSAGALVGVARPNYRIETAFLWWVIGGFLCYDIALWGLFAERVGVVDGLAPPYGPALGMGILVILLGAQLLRLTKQSRKLIKDADHARLG